MANKYCNLAGTSKINATYTDINTGFAGVEADIDAEVAAREQTDADVAALDARVDTIIQGGGPDKDAELVDIRTPDESYTPVATITVAGDMTRDMQAQFVSHKAETATQIVNIHEFPRIAGETTDDGRLRRALDSLPNGYGIVQLDGEIYSVTEPVVLDWYQGLRGIYGVTEIQKTGNATVTDHPYDSILGLKITSGESIMGNTIQGVTFRGMSQNAYGINLLRATHTDIRNVFVYEVQTGIYGELVWLASYKNVDVRNLSFNGAVGVNILDGTSNLFERCWAKKFDGGFNLGSTMYSSFVACVAETFINYAFFGGAGASFDGCGAEDARLSNGGYIFGSGARSLSINGGHALSINTDQTAGLSSLFYFNGSRATVNGFRLASFTTGSLIDMVKVDSDGAVQFNNCQLPSNYYRLTNITNSLGRVVISDGDVSSFYYSDSTKNFSRSGNDYVLGLKKGSGVEVLGQPNTVPFSADTNVYRSTHFAFNGAVKQLLQISSLPAGTSITSFHFKVIVNKTNGGTALLQGSGTISNGTKSGITLTAVYGTAYNVTISWNGDFLECTVGEASANAIVETSVFQRVTSATVKMLWL